jgi:hypothetical protein
VYNFSCPGCNFPYVGKTNRINSLLFWVFWEKRRMSELPYWYLISRVLNFTILARQYFAGFYFRDLNGQIWKKGITFRDSSVLKLILFFKKSELLKFLGKLESFNGNFDDCTKDILRDLYECSNSDEDDS